MADRRAALPDPDERGRTTVHRRVVPRIAAVAASEVEDTIDEHWGWTSLVRQGLPHADAEVAGGEARVRVDVAATFSTPLAEMAAEVRDHVAARVTELSGFTVVAVDVAVTDVVDVATRRRAQ